MKRDLPAESDTQKLAEDVYTSLADDYAGWLILLSGDLGAGKSTFARAFLKAAGHRGAVPSPTYTLVEPYDLPPGSIYHIDLYRLSSPDELQYLGWDELEQSLRLVEWPDRAPGIEAQADLLIHLAYRGTGRTVEMTAFSERGESLIQKIN